jgi:organic radical activating enzyme
MLINTQAIEKQNPSNKETLRVHSIFYTIQGEGPFAGQTAIFIRLAGCNLQCPKCDTEYTEGSQSMNIQEIINEATWINKCADLVVITGGEPFRQNITELVNQLYENEFRVQIETNGTLYLKDFPFNKVTVICSPKSGKINPKLLPHISALKYVVSSNDVDEKDGLPNRALGLPAKVARPPANFTGTVYIQAADEQDEYRNEINLRAAKDAVLNFGYTLCIQIHKLVGVE